MKSTRLKREVPMNLRHFVFLFSLSAVLIGRLASAQNTLSPNLSGFGTVTSTDPPPPAPPISCTRSGSGLSGACSATYANGTQVILNATGADNWQFLKWNSLLQSGCNGANPCVLTMPVISPPTATFVSCPAGTAVTYGLTKNSQGRFDEINCVDMSGNVTPLEFSPFSLSGIPWLGIPAFAPLVVSFQAQGNQDSSFFTPARFDLFANGGGVYSNNPAQKGAQTPFPAVTTNTVMTTRGQGISLFGYVKGLGIGNAIWGNGGVECWGGSADLLGGGALPECSPLGEFDASQGSNPQSFHLSVFQGVIGSVTPLPNGNQVIHISSSPPPVGVDTLGERYLLNKKRQFTEGSVSTVNNNIINFVGTHWTTHSPSPVNQYIKLGSTDDLYPAPPAPIPCPGDDVKFDGYCIGHWYKVKAFLSDTQLQIETNFDTVGLCLSGPCSSYVLEEGVEIQSIDNTASPPTITIPQNAYGWAAGDTIYSPPNHLIVLVGLNLILNKTFKTGLADKAGSSGYDGIRIAQYGPALMDRALWITGAGPGMGGFRQGIVFNAFNGATGIDMSQTNFTQAAIAIPQSTGTNNMFKLGAHGEIFNDLNAGVTVSSDVPLPLFLKVNGNTGIVGNLAVGKTAAMNALDVLGRIRVSDESGGNNFGQIFTGSSGGLTATHVGSFTNIPLAFFTGASAPRMTIDTTGNVGIGTTTPGGQLEINGGVRLNAITASQPPCGPTVRGMIWVVQSDPTDTVQVCLRANGNYSWHSVPIP